MSKGRCVPPRVETVSCRHRWHPTPDMPGVFCVECGIVAHLVVEEVVDRTAFVLSVWHPEGKDLPESDVSAAGAAIVDVLRPVLHTAPRELREVLEKIGCGERNTLRHVPGSYAIKRLPE